MTDATYGHRQLPNWNDLPDKLRRALVDVVENLVAGSNVEDSAGDIALAFYDRHAEGLPVPIFPLFEHAHRETEAHHA